MKRRDLLKILGISTFRVAGKALAADPTKSLFPYVNEYDHIVYGLPAWYATTCRECPAGCGMLVKTHDGRPVKVEGNPEHPVSQGGLCALGQASLQGLYHPDRFKGPMSGNDRGALVPISREEAIGNISLYLEGLIKKGKQSKVAFLNNALGPSLGGLIDGFLEMIGAPAKITYEPLGMEAWRVANKSMFGRAEVPELLIEDADFILSFNSDFLEAGPSRVEHARKLASARERWGSGKKRFIHIGPRMSLTAANADEWLPIRPGSEGAVALAMVNFFKGASRTDVTLEAAARASGLSQNKITGLAERLVKTKPSLAVTGSVIGPNAVDTWKTVNFLNSLAGNINKTVRFGGGTGSDMSSYADLENLTSRMESGEVDALFVLGIDPVSLPLGERFARAAKKVGQRVVFAALPDKTTEIANMVIPAHHFLECWDDYSPRAGVDGLVQPTIRPLHDSMHPGDVLLSVAEKIDGMDMPGSHEPKPETVPAPQKTAPPLDGETSLPMDGQTATQTSGDTMSVVNGDTSEPAPVDNIEEPPGPLRYFDVLEKNWRAKAPWVAARKQGGVWTEKPAVKVKLSGRKFSITPPTMEAKDSETILELAPFASPLLYDGRGADRPWLREVADPVSKIAYDAWVELHPDTAKKLSVKTGDVVNIKTASGGGEGDWPVRITRGVRVGVAAVPISPAAQMDGEVIGDINNLMSDKPDRDGCISWGIGAVRITKTSKHIQLPFVQNTESQHHRGIGQYTDYKSRHAEREQWKEEHQRTKAPRVNMYEEHKYAGKKWGMVIDLDKCIGCNACVVSCYAENNLPVVGRKLLLERREMAWIRIERYYEEKNGSIRAMFVPMTCQHCDNAPCEAVCPVFATYHNHQGLNVQIYNRCIGTRFCSNNCPYKVRRFNWFSYNWQAPLHLQLNPEVTVREKGVMEKCSFCIQRIVSAKHQAKLEGRKMKDGDVVTACAQSCPTRAIVFGDLNDPKSKVAKLSEDGRAYKVLSELNARPAITYLKRVARKG